MGRQRDFKLPSARGKNRTEELVNFSNELKRINAGIGFKVSVRGWCYLLESLELVNKGEFNKAERIIKECTDSGYLPIDFVAGDEGRNFDGVEIPETRTPLEHLGAILSSTMYAEDYYSPDWWNGEKYYIQMAVEKVDLKTLFQPVCKEYHIPITNMRGQSSRLQRAEIARRFKDAESRGLQCVLLYCGDFDPDGIRISDRLKENIAALKDIRWQDGALGYNPENLIVDRFGLNYDYIEENNLPWIKNLITGSGQDLTATGENGHRNNSLDYVQDYIKRFDARKCEANTLVTIPDKAHDLCEGAIIKYLGASALSRFRVKHEDIKRTLVYFREKYGITEFIGHTMAEIKKESIKEKK
jgi:hypothetical protein